MEVAYLLNNKYRVHEVAKDFKKNSKEITDILTKYATAPKNHMQVLEDRAVLWSLRGEGVNLMGLWDVTHDPLGWAHAQAALPERVRALRREGALNVLLSHRPSLLEEYGAGGADVVFCGHAHGGQVRLPLAGPVFAPDEGLFPKHTAGVYQAGETRMVVSRGLGNGTPYPRLWNGPELVVVTMKRAGT